MEYIVCKDKTEGSKKAYEIMKKYLKENSVLGLATGSTPTELYKFMIEDYKNGNFSYKNIKTFNLDEYVNLDFSHHESYHSFMDKNLFNFIDIKRENINIPCPDSNDNQELEKRCKEYDQKLKENKINIQILGLGQNGHIGFNEPFTPFDTETHIVDLTENTIEANKIYFDNNVDLIPKRAMTMGIKSILNADVIILLAFGKNKKDAITKLFTAEANEEYPCTALQSHNNVYIIVDEASDYKN